MELRDALLKRRSVRKFEDKPVERELIEELLHAAMSGPSACNKQPWEFYVISGNALTSLRDASRFMNILKKYLLSARAISTSAEI